jgi:glycosyltransferase involved in cell wall biosynthesis
VTVVLASKGKLDQPGYEIDGVRVRPLKAKFLEQYANRFERWAGLDFFYYLLPVAWAAWAQVQEDFDYDVVEVTDWALLFLPWMAAEKRAPVVVSLHGSCGQVDWFGKGEPRTLDGDLIRMVEAAALRGADVVHANSRANAEFWQEKTGREIRVIPPAYGGGTKADLTTEDTEVTETAVGPCLDKPSGALFSNPFTSELARGSENISPTRSASGPANSEDLKLNSYKLKTPPPEAGAALDSEPSSLDSSSPATSYSLPATAPQALKGLVVGRLQNYKGADLLCKALRLVPGIEMEWVGGDTDWGQSGIKANEYLAANYPDVFGKRLRWLGQLDRAEVSEKMKAAAFLVAPSFLDVFNLTVAEGMEAGLPVVCSRAAGAEMLIEHGHSGLLFDPAKPDELAACLNRIVEMSAVDRNEMGRKAQEAVKALLSEERILNLLEGSYKEVIEKGIPQRIDEWLESLLSPGAGLKAPSQVGFARRVLRKFGRMLTQI